MSSTCLLRNTPSCEPMQGGGSPTPLPMGQLLCYHIKVMRESDPSTPRRLSAPNPLLSEVRSDEMKRHVVR